MIVAQPQAANFDKLRTSPFSVDLNDMDCSVLAEMMEVRHVAGKEYLLVEGNRDDTLYVVIDGRLAVVKGHGNSERVLEYVYAGGIAGAMGFVDGEAHSASLRAVNDTEVLSLRGALLWGQLDRHPQLVYTVMRSIVRHAHRIVQNMNDQYVQLANYVYKENGRY